MHHCIENISFKSKWVWSGNTTHSRPTHGAMHEEEPQIIYSDNLQDINSKAASFLFLFKMIAKLEWTQCITKQWQTQNSQKQ